jgi:hypothetical protein
MKKLILSGFSTGALAIAILGKRLIHVASCQWQPTQCGVEQQVSFAQSLSPVILLVVALVCFALAARAGAKSRRS